MEMAIERLNLASASEPIPDYNQGPDPYQMVQVHDYMNVRFLRMDPTIRAASQKTISLFQAHYPEMLSRKFFVNVPFVMGWLFAAMKLVIASATTKKLSMLSYGEQLAVELGDGVPETYGGKGPRLEEGAQTVKVAKLSEDVKDSKAVEATEGGNTPAQNPHAAGEQSASATAVDAVQHMKANS